MGEEKEGRVFERGLGVEGFLSSGGCDRDQ